MDTDYEAQICSPEHGFPGVDKYYIRKSERGYPWGIFYVDEGNGIFLAFTDYGNWSHAWNHHGCESLKEFLVEILDKPYCVDKLAGGKREFNEQKTRKQVMADLFEARREQRFSKDEARRLYEDFDACFEDFGHDSASFQMAAYHMFDFHRLYPDYDLPIAKEVPQALRAAQRDLFVPLKNLLKQEMENENNNKVPQPHV